MDEQPILKAACHCKSVKFEVQLSEGLKTACRCTCSLCRMRGAIVAWADLSGLKITAGEDMLTEYRFHTGAARHYFCSQCGVYTHHQRRFDPSKYAINVACLEGVSPVDFAEVRVVDGVRHPNDVAPGTPLRRAGVLRFEAVSEADS